MDEYTVKHFNAWLETVHFLERDKVKDAILKLLEDDPDLTNDHSWPQLMRLAGV